MSTKVLTVNKPAGYSLKSNYSALQIDKGIAVGGYGVKTTGTQEVFNYGSVISTGAGTNGVYLKDGGGVLNNYTGTISGQNDGIAAAGALGATILNYHDITGSNIGIELFSGGLVSNFGYLAGGVDGIYGFGSVTVTNTGTLGSGGAAVDIAAGSVTNGGGTNTSALISGNYGVAIGDVGTVTNLGTISYFGLGLGKVGVELEGGGTITNGSLTDRYALIAGQQGVYAAEGTAVNNFAQIHGVGTTIGVVGVVLESGATLTNGSAKDGSAVIEGYTGVEAVALGTSVNNFGAIYGTGGATQAAVYDDGGVVTNGSGLDTAPVIRGATAIRVADNGYVRNFAAIEGTGLNAGYYGANFTDGGTLINGSTGSHFGAFIDGYVGVKFAGAAGTLTNLGVVEGLAVGGDYFAVRFYGVGGTVTNGNLAVKTATIEGYNGVAFGGAATLTNYADITATNIAVALYEGGAIKNGGATDQSASISGLIGVFAVGGNASVANYGTITSEESVFGAVTGQAFLSVTNGSTGDRTAQITGAYGLISDYGGGSGETLRGVVTNYATITGQAGAGIAFNDGGQVTNGAALDTKALIQGVTDGVIVRGTTGTVSNFAVIDGATGVGVSLAAGGHVTNGGGSFRSSLIEGDNGVETGSVGFATVNNFATIAGSGIGDYGVNFGAGGAVTNGSVNNSTALIEGYGGVRLAGAGTSTNFGTIWGTGDAGGAGANLSGGASLTNGSAAKTGAVIEGFTGVYIGAGASGTLTNFGTVIGTAGTAVNFVATPGAVLAVEAGSVFIGAVNGGGGTLDLASGVGTLTGLLSSAGNVTVSGSMATTTFSGFGTVEVGTGASFTTAGGAIAAAQALNVAGTLTNTGTLTVAGSLTTTGTLAGTGTLALTGGTSSFDTGTSLTIAKVTQSGSSVADVADASLTYAGVWAQTAGTISVAAGDKATFTGTGNSFSGTLAGAGIVAFTAGSDTLSGTTISVTDTDIDTATTLSGTVDATGSVFVTTPSIVVATTGATLTGGGAFYLSNTATNEIEGASAAATLTNVSDRIDGAGLLGGGQMVLVNDAAGLIAGNQALGLTINTGTSTITNAGVIEDTGAGGTTIVSNLNNTGTLQSLVGTLTVQGTVTGAGVIHIASGAADFTSTTAALAENVTFTGTTGVLELANSQHFTGTVSGFSKTGTTSLDLRDITYVLGTTKESYSGNTTSGILTVTSGAEVANITLEGNYTTSTFTLLSDGSGGTTVVDPTAPAAGTPGHISPVQPLIAAMASLGGDEGAAVAGPSFEVKPYAAALLAASRSSLA